MSEPSASDSHQSPSQRIEQLERELAIARGENPGLRALPAWYASVIEHSPDAIFSADTMGRLFAVNVACEKLSGFSVQELAGMPWERLVPAEEIERLREHFARGLQGASQEFEATLVRKDGSLVSLALSSGPIYEGDKLVGMFAHARDISVRKQAERALRDAHTAMEEMVEQRTHDLQLANAFLAEQVNVRRAAEEQVRAVTRGARCILWHSTITGAPGWETDYTGSRFFWWQFDLVDEEAGQRVVPLEIPPGKSYQDVWLAARHAEDRPGADRTSAGAMIRGEGSYTQEFRVTDRYGRVRWLREDVILEKIGDAKWRAVGVCTDVSDRKAVEEALKRSHEELEIRVEERTAALAAAAAEAEVRARQAEEARRTLEALMAHVPEGIVILDSSGDETRVRAVSQHAATLAGLKRDEIVGMSGRAYADRFVLRRPGASEAAPLEERPTFRAAARGETVTNEEWVLLPQAGKPVPVLCNAGPIFDEHNRLLGGVMVWRDITPLQMARDAALADAQHLEKARAELEAANRAKDQFLASLSHELRTPLTPVLLAAQDMERQLPPPLKSEMLMIRRNVELMTRLIDDLLDLTRVSRGKLVLNREAADAHAAIDSAMGICAADARTKGVVITRELSATATTLDADPARLRQALWNLLSNAIKFTPPGGTVIVRTFNAGVSTTVDARDTHPPALVIEISDTGIGIKPDDAARIFDPFEQGDAQVTRRFGGLGLGLAITRAIVGLHGGTIKAESVGIGHGATFRLTLPALPARLPALPVEAAIEVKPERTAALSILLVEDHQDTARVLQRLLEAEGHRVERVGSIAQLSTVADREFDLLISDIGLPDGSGIDAIRIMRPRVRKAIALSGYGMADDVERSRRAGFDEHLVKPIDFTRLEAVLRTMKDE